jgi:hypothetical protein
MYFKNISVFKGKQIHKENFGFSTGNQIQGLAHVLYIELHPWPP